MARATIGGVEYEIAPMNFRRMQRAAPFIDGAKRATGDALSVSDMMAVSQDVLAVVAIGINREDVTADSLADQATVPEVMALNTAFIEILREAGLIGSGEPKPEEAPAPKKASRAKSIAS